MQNQFFHSKGPIVPGNQSYLERPHLHQLLEKAMQSPLVTVVAGAGYGKTYAVYSFLRTYPVITAWMQLSDRDNLRSRFWENFVQVVAHINRNSADKLAALGFPETKRKFEQYLVVPSVDILSEVKYVFVYDDFHLLYDQAVLDFLERSVSFPFPNITSILISRKEPEINTIPLLAKGLLAKITEDDLRFSQREMLDYLHTQDIRVSPEAASAIYRDTEGWAFAIHLTSLSLKKGAVSTDYARSSMKLNIFKLMDYEIFSFISEDLQRYLIKLSLIEHWPLELLSELADDPELIEKVNQLNSFIRYDIYLNTYQIHPLLLEYLSNKQVLLTQEEKQAVYSSAAAWCLKHNFKMDAVNYYEKIGDYDKIMDMIYHQPQMMANDMAQFLLGVFERAPRDLYKENGTAHILYIRLFLVLGRFEEALAKLNAIIEEFDILPTSPYKSRVLFGSYMNLGFYGMLTCLHTQSYTFYLDYERASFYCPAKGFDLITSAYNLSIGPYICRVSSAEKGHMEQFIEAVTRTVPYVSTMINGCMYGYDDLARAELAYFQEEMPQAEHFALTALYKAREKKQYEIETRALFYLLRLNLAFGKYTILQGVFKQLDAQKKIAEYAKRHVLYDIFTGWFYAQIGDSARIPDWLRNDFEDSDLNSLMHGIEILVKVKYQLSEKRYSAALATLKSQSNHYKIQSFLMGNISKKASEAVCYYKLKEQEKAFMVLEEAYTLSKANRLTMIFIELGKDMRSLIGAALQTGECAIPKSWLENIYRRSAAYGKNLCAVKEKYQAQGYPQQQVRITPLSHREINILTGLSQGLTREEIADIYALSVNTVKSVITSIYIKLGAVNRADAVRIATTQGILKK